LGARGIKLHPRAQKFMLDDDRLAPVFELAAGRHVPILIHGGRGLPPIADSLHRLVDAYPEAQLIIAHAGIADLSGLAGNFAGTPTRIAAGEKPLAPSEPQGAEILEQPMALARIHQYLSMALPLVFARQQDTFGALGLAINACNERNGHVAELEQIHELLDVAR